MSCTVRMYDCVCVSGCIKGAFAWVVMTQTFVKHSCPDLFCRRSRVWWHPPSLASQSPPQPFDGPEWQVMRKRSEEEEGAPITGSCSAVSTSLLPLYITRMQIFKASRSEKRESVEMVQGFKSWSSLCESQTVTPPSSLPSSLCLKVSWFITQMYLCIFCWFYSVLKGWGAELCFRWSLNPSQIKPSACGPFITTVCSLKAREELAARLYAAWRAAGRPSLHISHIDRPACFYL